MLAGCGVAATTATVRGAAPPASPLMVVREAAARTLAVPALRVEVAAGSAEHVRPTRVESVDHRHRRSAISGDPSRDGAPADVIVTPRRLYVASAFLPSSWGNAASWVVVDRRREPDALLLFVRGDPGSLLVRSIPDNPPQDLSPTDTRLRELRDEARSAGLVGRDAIGPVETRHYRVRRDEKAIATRRAVDERRAVGGLHRADRRALRAAQGSTPGRVRTTRWFDVWVDRDGVVRRLEDHVSGTRTLHGTTSRFRTLERAELTPAPTMSIDLPRGADVTPARRLHVAPLRTLLFPGQEEDAALVTRWDVVQEGNVAGTAWRLDAGEALEENRCFRLTVSTPGGPLHGGGDAACGNGTTLGAALPNGERLVAGLVRLRADTVRAVYHNGGTADAPVVGGTFVLVLPPTEPLDALVLYGAGHRLACTDQTFSVEQTIC